MLILLSKDQLLLWSMEVCINVGKYIFHNVPKDFPDSNAGIVVYFGVDVLVECECRQAILLLVDRHLST